MSSSSANAAAKRRRGGVNTVEPQMNVNTNVAPQPPQTLTIPQSIYMLSDRINMLEQQMNERFENVMLMQSNTNTNNNTSSNEDTNEMQEQTYPDDIVTKSDFNDVMSSIGSDMNEINRKMSVLNEFVLSVQNSYLLFNNNLLDLSNKVNALTCSNKQVSLEIHEDKHSNESTSVNLTEKSTENNSNVSVPQNDDEENDDENYENENNGGNENNDDEEETAAIVSADITSRLKTLSLQQSNNNQVGAVLSSF